MVDKRNMRLPIPGTIRDASRAISAHLWVACDLGRCARHISTPGLVDLLARGRRKGFLESPDTLYSIGFLNIQRGAVYCVKTAPSNAFCTVISLHGEGQQTSKEFFKPRDDNTASDITIHIGDGLCSTQDLDASAYTGMTQIMVRQYFFDGEQAKMLPLPEIEILSSGENTTEAGNGTCAGIQAATKFLRWRLTMLFGMKYMQYRLGGKLPRNEFISKEEVSLLFKGIKTSLTRIGISSFHYLVCTFDIKAHQVLEIRYRPPRHRYFAFCINNDWMQGAGEGDQGAYLNSSQMKQDHDGCYTMYVGHKKLDGKNYVGLGGRTTGIISFREIGSEGALARPQCSLVDRSSFR